MFKVLLLICYFTSSSFSNSEAYVCASIDGIKSKKGSLQVAIYNSSEGFDKNKPYKTLTITKKKLNQGKRVFKFRLPAGRYGIAVLDDENNNGQMDYNWIGVPLEGFGFSNYQHTGLSKPKFKDFDFNHGNKDNKVTITMKYI